MSNDYKCQDCNCDINEGEFKTFGICDDCWDKHRKKLNTEGSEKPDDLLIRMTAVLGEIARAYDNNDTHGLKGLVNIGYELSRKGVEHCALMDSLIDENAALRKEIESVEEYRRAQGVKHWQQVIDLTKERDTLKAENERLKQDLVDESEYLRGVIKQTELDAAREIDKYRP